MLGFGVVVIGVTDKDRAKEFWCSALGYVAHEGVFGGWSTVLEAPDGSGAKIALQLSEGQPEAHPRIHLDLHVSGTEDQQAESDRLVGLGAELIDWDSYPDDPDFVVLADTEGNRFCIVDVDHVQT
jgi:catechol 2,3-dioxygenase-like lactoylglutathione lyase family enzyme